MKPYVKPTLLYESIELSQHIAACGIDVNHGDTTSCTPTLDPNFWGGLALTVFGDGRSCDMTPDAIEVYCYTVGTSEAGRTFNS
ncbi:MAG: hypothetical protein ACI3YK_05580 [Eubacteriales bacterium]